MEQMTIDDLFAPNFENLGDFNEMSESDIAEKLGEAVGLSFHYNETFKEYQTKVNKTFISVHLSHYSEGTNNGRAFISCGWWIATQGASGPFDSMKSAAKFLYKAKRRAET